MPAGPGRRRESGGSPNATPSNARSPGRSVPRRGTCSSRSPAPAGGAAGGCPSTGRTGRDGAAEHVHRRARHLTKGVVRGAVARPPEGLTLGRPPAAVSVVRRSPRSANLTSGLAGAGRAAPKPTGSHDQVADSRHVEVVGDKAAAERGNDARAPDADRGGGVDGRGHSADAQHNIRCTNRVPACTVDGVQGHLVPLIVASLTLRAVRLATTPRSWW